MATGEVKGEPAALAIQERAIRGLLGKVLPDLSSVELKSDPDNPLVTRVEYVVIDPSKNAAR